MVTIIIRWLVELVYQPEKRFGSDIITVIIVARLWLVCKTVPAAQHRVATDAPAGAFKIGPISWESLCHLSCFSSPGARLNAKSLGRMWLVDSFCVGAIRRPTRLFGASGRHSGQMLTLLDG